jgi:ABC-type sulfate transport system permease component
MKFEGKHWGIVAALLVSMATQISGLQHGWQDMTSPQFVSGLLMSIATTIGALFVGSPTEKNRP